jgi:outer membrane immunogenic protein
MLGPAFPSAGLFTFSEATMRMFRGAAFFVAALMLATANLARAADLPSGPYYAPPPQLQPPPSSIWMGPYLGATIGYEWGTVDNSPTRPSGIVGGVEGGYNWQRGWFVLGAEADIQLSGADDTISPFEFSNRWFGTVRARGGVALNNVLLYGTGGLSYGDLRAQSFNLTETHTTVGWVAGAGVEVALNPNWSAKAEWLYLQLSDSTFSLTGASNGFSGNILRVGANYHF